MDPLPYLPVGFQTNENPDLLHVSQRGMELVKTADVEIPDEAIEEARILGEQCRESVAKGKT